jgi:hypothetical protein
MKHRSVSLLVFWARSSVGFMLAMRRLTECVVLKKQRHILLNYRKHVCILDFCIAETWSLSQSVLATKVVSPQNILTEICNKSQGSLNDILPLSSE